ncbi:MAG: GNAT family N-acetyltransferase [Chitinophagaceae bacterium]|nr:MAG: GNAT family N-acetyltransferase [Chitinophagaceae bacterium]
MEITIRRITPGDNAAIATIIRDTLTEFGANKPGTVFYDESTDHLFELFGAEGSVYLVAERDGRLLGGGGIYPTEGLPHGTAELVKMYLLPEARGIGLGKKMMEAAFEEAKKMGYTALYLETMPELRKAISAYEKAGFSYLPGPLGNSTHTGCDLWMLKSLEA